MMIHSNSSLTILFNYYKCDKIKNLPFINTEQSWEVQMFKSSIDEVPVNSITNFV